MKNWKIYAIFIVLTLLVGALSGFISMEAMGDYATLDKPILSPPAWLFPVVWSILFILMGIGAARFYIKIGRVSLLFVIQLIFNFFWSIIFFNLENYLLAFVWLVILWALILLCTVLFYGIDKRAGYLMIPYLLWVTFAGYLNFGIYLLN
jgi:tryptophan-rich sensory protein